MPKNELCGAKAESLGAFKNISRNMSSKVAKTSMMLPKGQKVVTRCKTRLNDSSSKSKLINNFSHQKYL